MATARDIVLDGKVAEVHFLGSVIRLKVDLGDNAISLDTFNDQRTAAAGPLARRCAGGHRLERRAGAGQLKVVNWGSTNILFITADQWRGSATGYAGHPVVKTPNLDELAAKDGVAFLNHYSQAAPCSPARAALYTGLYQMNNRVVPQRHPLANRFDNIACAARRAGYDPTLFGYTDVSPDPTGLHQNDPGPHQLRGRAPRLSPRG